MEGEIGKFICTTFFSLFVGIKVYEQQCGSICTDIGTGLGLRLGLLIE